METQKKKNDCNVKVFCRVKPMKLNPKCFSGTSAFDMTQNQVIDISNKKTYTFNHVFNGDTQEYVYEQVGSQLVKDLLNGINGTILAYGQTNAGKTYTMMGDNLNFDCETLSLNMGIIPRTAHELFIAMEKVDSGTEFTVKVSFLEIYMDNIRDLFDCSGSPLTSNYTDKEGLIFTGGKIEKSVQNKEDLIKWLKLGLDNRKAAEKENSSHSSKSHVVFQIHVLQDNKVKGRMYDGKLVLVDLAGSEKCDENGEKETNFVNQSLLYLGNVIKDFSEKKNPTYTHTPLTMLLKDSLGGNSITNFVICIVPNNPFKSESLYSLEFGNKAKMLQNSVKNNVQLSYDELARALANEKTKVFKLTEQIATLKSGNPSKISEKLGEEEAIKSLREIEKINSNEELTSLRKIITSLEGKLELQDSRNILLTTKLTRLESDLKDKTKVVNDEIQKNSLFETALNDCKIKLSDLKNLYTSFIKEMDNLETVNARLVKYNEDAKELNEKLETEFKIANDKQQTYEIIMKNILESIDQFSSALEIELRNNLMVSNSEEEQLTIPVILTRVLTEIKIRNEKVIEQNNQLNESSVKLEECENKFLELNLSNKKDKDELLNFECIKKELNEKLLKIGEEKAKVIFENVNLKTQIQLYKNQIKKTTQEENPNLEMISGEEIESFEKQFDKLTQESNDKDKEIDRFQSLTQEYIGYIKVYKEEIKKLEGQEQICLKKLLDSRQDYKTKKQTILDLLCLEDRITNQTNKLITSNKENFSLINNNSDLSKSNSYFLCLIIDFLKKQLNEMQTNYQNVLDENINLKSHIEREQHRVQQLIQRIRDLENQEKNLKNRVMENNNIYINALDKEKQLYLEKVISISSGSKSPIINATIVIE